MDKEQMYKVFGVNEEMLNSVNHEEQWNEFQRNGSGSFLITVDGKEYIGGVDLANKVNE